MIPLQPTHNPKLNCFDDIIAFIARIEQIHFELCLSKAWRFQMLENTTGLLGNRININSSCNLEALKNVHGISCVPVHVPFNTQGLSAVYETYDYIIVHIDTYYCWWDKSYKTLHNPGHTVLINEIDFKREIVYITDPFYEKGQEAIPFDYFNQAVQTGYVVSIDNSVEQADRHYVKELILSDLEGIQLDFKDIKKLAKMIPTIQMKDEIAGYDNVWHAPIIFSLGRVALGRLRYSMILEYLVNMYQFKFQPEIQMLERVADQWQTVRSIIVKYYYADNFSNIERIQDMLLNIYKTERTIYKNLINKLR